MKSVFALLLILLTFLLHAQEHDSLLFRKTICHGLADSKALLTAPAQWNSRKWLLAGGTLAATSLLIAHGDEAIYNSTGSINSSTIDRLFWLAEPAGNYYPLLALGALMTHGLISKNNYSAETAVIMAEALLISTVTVHTVKSTAGRQRPNALGTTDPYDWKGPFFKGTSFFSGHTITAFTAASVVAYRYRDHIWIPVTAYSLATLGGLQRIVHQRHWASDVLMGAAVGTTIGIFISKQWDNNSIRFFPTVSPQHTGLSMSISIK